MAKRKFKRHRDEDIMPSGYTRYQEALIEGTSNKDAGDIIVERVLTATITKGIEIVGRGISKLFS